MMIQTTIVRAEDLDPSKHVSPYSGFIVSVEQDVEIKDIKVVFRRMDFNVPEEWEQMEWTTISYVPRYETFEVYEM